MRRLVILAVVLVAALATVVPASAGGRPLATQLTGAAEVPGPGDSDGSGSAWVMLNPGRHQACFHIEASDVEPITSAHIHAGAAGVAGGIVVNFNVGGNGLSGCAGNIDADVMHDIMSDPASYYVNVHNAEFPAGALRGQLGQATGRPPVSPSSRPDQTPGLPIYLAMGDSWAWGQGVTSGTEATAGYVGQLHLALKTALDCLPAASSNAADGCKHLQLVNLGRPARDGLPGVKASDVQAEQLPIALPMLESRNGDANPRNDVELVTLHVGGNDVSGPIQLACLGGLTEGCLATWLTEMGQFEVELHAVVSALRDAAGEDTPIVLGTYDNPVPYCFLYDLYGDSAVLLGAAVLEGIDVPIPGDGILTLDGIHDVIRRVAADFGAEVAEVFGAMDGTDFLGGGDCLHLVESGHDKVTTAFLDALGL